MIFALERHRPGSECHAMSPSAASEAMSCSRQQSKFKGLQEAADMSEASERQERGVQQRALPEESGPAEGAEVVAGSAVRSRWLLPSPATMRWLCTQSATAVVSELLA